MSFKGDSETQALLRDRRIKKAKKTVRSRFASAIASLLKPETGLLDIGCGTAHILQELSESNRSSALVGLDVSRAMVKIAKSNTLGSHNVELVEGDGFRLPFPSRTFDIVATRLADYSQKEAYRVLKRRGHLFEYGLGPEADKEVKEFFPERIEKENFFFPKDLKKWKQEVCEDIVGAGFTVSYVEDFKEANCYENEEELMDLIEMVPLVKGFNRRKIERRSKSLRKSMEVIEES